MTAQTYILFNFNSANLQVFFAIIAFIEEHPNSIYLIDRNNASLLQEATKTFPIKTQELNSLHSKYRTVTITINHSKPLTVIEGVKSSALIFPKLIVENFHKPRSVKNQKIYFRGLLTATRLAESFLLFLNLRDFNAMFQLLKAGIFYKKEHTINSSKVYFKFTNRGRQASFKYIDADYYQEMANFETIFCPKGDFIWTYRFFEAIQVGSIPLCKHYCSAYANYDYVTNPSEDSKTDSISSEQNLTHLQNTLNYKRED